MCFFDRSDSSQCTDWRGKLTREFPTPIGMSKKEYKQAIDKATKNGKKKKK